MATMAQRYQSAIARCKAKRTTAEASIPAADIETLLRSLYRNATSGNGHDNRDRMVSGTIRETVADVARALNVDLEPNRPAEGGKVVAAGG